LDPSRLIHRTVQVTTKGRSLFSYAMAAKLDINFSGNNITVNSYDSRDPNYSTGGLYDPAKPKAGASVGSLLGNVNVQNGNIFGTALTGTNGQINVGSQGVVGDLAWDNNRADYGSAQPGSTSHDFNMDFPEITAPTTNRMALPAPTNGILNLTVSNALYYVPSDFPWGRITALNVSAPGVKIHVTGNFSMSQGNSINISTNASLQLYVGTDGTYSPGSTSATFTTVVNPSAAAFQFFGLRSTTALDWRGNANCIGCVYAPDATFTLHGGGNDVQDFQGCCAVNQVVMTGHFNFHYDEALNDNGPSIGFKVASWRELR
jgi:hypothetical protein